VRGVGRDELGADALKEEDVGEEADQREQGLGDVRADDADATAKSAISSSRGPAVKIAQLLCDVLAAHLVLVKGDVWDSI
jgi:hypothetical protein